MQPHKTASAGKVRNHNLLGNRAYDSAYETGLLLDHAKSVFSVDLALFPSDERKAVETMRKEIMSKLTNLQNFWSKASETHYKIHDEVK